MGYENSLKLKILKYLKNYFYTELLKFAEDFIALYWLIIKEYLNDDEYLFNDDGNWRKRDFYTVNFHEGVISKRNLNLILEKC